MITSIMALNNKELVSGGSDRNIIIWEIPKGKIVNIFKGHSDWITKLQKINNHQFLSASNDNSIMLWDT